MENAKNAIVENAKNGIVENIRNSIVENAETSIVENINTHSSSFRCDFIRPPIDDGEGVKIFKS